MNHNLKEHIVHGTTQYPFTIYHIQKSDYPIFVPLHWHDEVELIYVQKGTLHLTIDKTSYTGTPGNIFIVNSQEIHEMSVTKNDAIYYTILFPLSSLLFQTQDNANLTLLAPLAEQKMQFSTNLSFSKHHVLYETLIKELIHIYYDKHTAYQLGTKSHLMTLIYFLYRHEEIIESKKDLTYNKVHREILYYINEHYTDTITLEQIASHFHMSPKYFSRYFINTFYTSFTEYILHLRLEHAITLLNTSELTITEIALQSGFSSCSYFNKRFKKAFGKSPKNYLQYIKTNDSTH